MKTTAVRVISLDQNRNGIILMDSYEGGEVSMKQYTHNQLVTGSNPAEECENQCHIIAEVTGSNPVSPTILYGR